jgi:hypothetical protein
MVVKRLHNIKCAAFQLVIYYPRCRKTFKVTEIVEERDLDEAEDGY